MKTVSCKAFAAATTLLLLALSVDNLKANEAKSDTARENIAWSDLAPNNGKPFSDPFAKLTSDQLDDLSYVIRVRRLIADEKISGDGKDAKEAAQLAGKLQQQGVDIAWLMVQRDRVQQIRGLQVERVAKAIGESLRDKRVTLTGYVIPCKVDVGRVTEFFLVPTVAACSHEDAPPRLQVVFVSSEQGIAPPGRSTPASVTGKIVANTTTRSTFNANGRVLVHSAYAMPSPEIKVLKPTGNANTSPKQWSKDQQLTKHLQTNRTGD